MDVNQELYEKLVNEEFDKIDIDMNGYIDASEFIANLKNSMKGIGIEMDDSTIEEHMKTIDLNNDKKISREEYKKYFASLVGKND